ncbi:hypothetical protein SAMN05444920_10829 [Nonomuraea solani]|uniref:Uncharacterized protein n=1 Tax=Nonomuraea solani TaxID=1144553 RepID=A0A1H6E7Y1_9ACTN|nr:hypothetical protein [Nonomuraea solani]SEG93066.1 hypothetical protein SAMN05444920_10829 [Nonomuraea solani]
MNIADLAKVKDEDLSAEPVGRSSGAGARALMESIMGEEREEEREPVRGRFPVRRSLGLSVIAAGLATSFVIWTPFGRPATEFANAAVSIKTGADFVEVEINDPEAEAETFAEAFRAVGLNAEVRKAPVAPEEVGVIVPVTDGDFPAGTGMTVTTVTEGCKSAWCGRVAMPVGFTGRFVIGIGRPAAPGERYSSSVGSEVDGPLIDGFQPRGKPVSEVRAAMKRSGLKIEYVVVWTVADGSGGGYNVPAEHVKGDWVVGHVQRTASDSIRVLIDNPPGVPKDSLPRADPPPAPDWWKD